MMAIDFGRVLLLLFLSPVAHALGAWSLQELGVGFSVHGVCS